MLSIKWIFTIVLFSVLYLLWGTIALLFAKKKNQMKEPWTFYFFFSGLRGRIGLLGAFAILIIDLIIWPLIDK